jgi:hypothetical protein
MNFLGALAMTDQAWEQAEIKLVLCAQEDYWMSTACSLKPDYMRKTILSSRCHYLNYCLVKKSFVRNDLCIFPRNVKLPPSLDDSHVTLPSLID